ncbi:MAG TPA: 23S rRNA (guanosine(2251)-2'-O)-methyltransferase RlmB [Deinococcales bacterium]|nr:23S rRNA (guanosine(2251)-2'-O)-methyltransferase RlmB [Deinococcales bacterium]
MLIFGRNPVLEALASGQVQAVYVARGVEPGFARQIEEASRAANVPLHFRPRLDLDQAVRTTSHQGVVAELEDAQFADLSEAFELAERRGEVPFLVLLDGITDPHNFGAIIRSAEVLGAHGVVVEERRSAPLSATVVKTSAGATSYLPVAQVKNLPRAIDDLKDRGLWVYGAAGEASRTLEQLDWDRPVALVIGSEGEGMRRLVREKCDELVRIPTRGKVQSLNASVAAAILIYAGLSQRGGA